MIYLIVKMGGGGGGVEALYELWYNYTIVQHPWQVSENHKPQVFTPAMREIGKSVRYLMKHKIEL